MATSTLKDPDFGVSSFKGPKMTSESETICNNILTLLFMRPGSYPSIPHLGIHIQDYLYQFFDDIDTTYISNMIAAQCQEFLPSVNDGDLSVKKLYDPTDGKPVLLIVLPTIINEETTGLGIAISSNENGEITYNSMIDKSLLA